MSTKSMRRLRQTAGQVPIARLRADDGDGAFDLVADAIAHGVGVAVLDVHEIRQFIAARRITSHAGKFDGSLLQALARGKLDERRAARSENPPVTARRRRCRFASRCDCDSPQCLWRRS